MIDFQRLSTFDDGTYGITVSEEGKTNRGTPNISCNFLIYSVMRMDGSRSGVMSHVEGEARITGMWVTKRNCFNQEISSVVCRGYLVGMPYAKSDPWFMRIF